MKSYVCIVFGSFFDNQLPRGRSTFSLIVFHFGSSCAHYRRFDFLFTVISHVCAPLIWQEVALLRAVIVLALILETLSMCRETAAVHLAT